MFTSLTIREFLMTEINDIKHGMNTSHEDPLQNDSQVKNKLLKLHELVKNCKGDWNSTFINIVKEAAAVPKPRSILKETSYPPHRQARHCFRGNYADLDDCTIEQMMDEDDHQTT